MKIKRKIPSQIFTVLLLSFSFSAFAQYYPGNSIFIRQSTIQIPRYQVVSEGIFRGGRPTIGDHAQIKRNNNIKTIINLENDMRQAAIDQSESAKVGINFYSEPMSAFKEPNDEQVARVLKALTNKEYYPIFIHCKHGEDRTGMIIGLYRVFVEKWTPQQAYEEMLKNGFHPSLYKLNNYFKRKTGLR